MLVKMGKNVCLELSIPFYMNTTKRSDFFQHIVGTFKVVLGGSFFCGGSLFLVKMSKHLEFTCGQITLFQISLLTI